MSKLARILLGVSLLFNAMFAIGYLSAQTSADTTTTPTRTADLVADKLGLDASQREAFIALRQEIGEKAHELQQAALVAEQELWVASCDPKADPENIAKLKSDLSEFRRARRELGFRQFNRFLELLTPEQRKSVTEKLRRHGPHGRFRGPHWGRFDTDKDGKLSKDERAKLMESCRERFRKGSKDFPRHEGRRPPPGSPGSWRRGPRPRPPKGGPGPPDQPPDGGEPKQGGRRTRPDDR